MDGDTNVTAESTAGAENATETNNQQGQNTENQQAQESAQTLKTYTAEELQAETDRRVTEAVKTANAKSEEAFKKRLEDARADWEKESKMTAAERERVAEEKAKAAFKKEKAEFEHEKLVVHAERELIKNNLPGELAASIAGVDEDTTVKNITAIKTAFDKAVEAAVNEKLKGKSPASGGGNNEPDAFLSGFGL